MLAAPLSSQNQLRSQTALPCPRRYEQWTPCDLDLRQPGDLAVYIRWGLHRPDVVVTELARLEYVHPNELLVLAPRE